MQLNGIDIDFITQHTSYDINNFFVEVHEDCRQDAINLGINFDDRFDITDEELISLIYDVYEITIKSPKQHCIDFFNECNTTFKNMSIKLENVTADGVIEEGYLEIEVEHNEETYNLCFDIRQENFGDLITELEIADSTTEDLLKKMGIDFDDHFKNEMCCAYDRGCNE